RPVNCDYLDAVCSRPEVNFCKFPLFVMREKLRRSINIEKDLMIFCDIADRRDLDDAGRYNVRGIWFFGQNPWSRRAAKHQPYTKKQNSHTDRKTQKEVGRAHLCAPRSLAYFRTSS